MFSLIIYAGLVTLTLSAVLMPAQISKFPSCGIVVFDSDTKNHVAQCGKLRIQNFDEARRTHSMNSNKRL